VDRLRLLSDPDLELAVIDLRLLARLSLEPHRRGFLPTPAITTRF
jgi:hypothetical protein